LTKLAEGKSDLRLPLRGHKTDRLPLQLNQWSRINILLHMCGLKWLHASFSYGEKMHYLSFWSSAFQYNRDIKTISEINYAGGASNSINTAAAHKSICDDIKRDSGVRASLKVMKAAL
jgi:hypothetical protein